MKAIFKILSLICVTLSLTGTPQAKEWRGIVPLHSTRADVERLLGLPFDEGNIISSYRLKDDVVEVIYAKGLPCEHGTIENGWMVPRDTVINITVNTPNWFPFSTLKIDKGKYKETKGWHVQDTSYFTDEEEGVSYVVKTVVIPETKEVRKGMVTSITYMPSAKDNLECPAPPPASNKGMHPTRNQRVSYQSGQQRAGDAGR